MSAGKPVSPALAARIREVAAKEPELRHLDLAERFELSLNAIRNALKGTPQQRRKQRKAATA